VRLITRNDASLAVALIGAALILFNQPLRHLIDVAGEVESRYHLDLLPALVLLVSVFTFHQYRKRAQARVEALAAAADAAAARTQSRTLQQLMNFSQALANALDRSTLQRVLWKHLPAIARDRQFWVLARKGDHWEMFLHDATTTPRPLEVLERYADQVLGETSSQPTSTGSDEGPDTCFPMIAGGTLLGVLGIGHTPRLTTEERNIIGAAAALLAIGIKNMQLFVETRELSLRDSLTGCFKREHGLQTLDAELRRARRTGSPLSILMIDVDRFKTVNDRFGHIRGDELLGTIGNQLVRLARGTDVRCRYGGDEFLLILPETDAPGAHQLAHSLCHEIANMRIVADEQIVPVTVSVGVATAEPGEMEAKGLIHRADDALYAAKDEGRNRVSVAAGMTVPLPRRASSTAACL
jgi:diguanylate cyclase (GGDEF)-like protein